MNQKIKEPTYYLEQANEKKLRKQLHEAMDEFDSDKIELQRKLNDERKKQVTLMGERTD